MSITTGGNLTLGHQYTLTCDVSVASGLGPPTVQWVGPGSSAPTVTGGDFTVSSTSPYTLTINPLRQSHTGQYTCQATVGGDTGTASVMVEIAGIRVMLPINTIAIYCETDKFKQKFAHDILYIADFIFSFSRDWIQLATLNSVQFSILINECATVSSYL